MEIYKSKEEDDALPGMTDELLEDTFLASSLNPSIYVGTKWPNCVGKAVFLKMATSCGHGRGRGQPVCS